MPEPSFIDRRRAAFLRWWHAPTTFRDRVNGVVVGAVGGFVAGALGRIMAGALPVPLGEVAAWGLGAAAFGAVAGAIFPKLVSWILLPFATFGGTS